MRTSRIPAGFAYRSTPRPRSVGCRWRFHMIRHRSLRNSPDAGNYLIGVKQSSRLPAGRQVLDNCLTNPQRCLQGRIRRKSPALEACLRPVRFLLLTYWLIPPSRREERKPLRQIVPPTPNNDFEILDLLTYGERANTIKKKIHVRSFHPSFV